MIPPEHARIEEWLRAEHERLHAADEGVSSDDDRRWQLLDDSRDNRAALVSLIADATAEAVRERDEARKERDDLWRMKAGPLPTHFGQTALFDEEMESADFRRVFVEEMRGGDGVLIRAWSAALPDDVRDGGDDRAAVASILGQLRAARTAERAARDALDALREGIKSGMGEARRLVCEQYKAERDAAIYDAKRGIDGGNAACRAMEIARKGERAAMEEAARSTEAERLRWSAAIQRLAVFFDTLSPGIHVGLGAFVHAMRTGTDAQRDPPWLVDAVGFAMGAPPPPAPAEVPATDGADK